MNYVVVYAIAFITGFLIGAIVLNIGISNKPQGKIVISDDGEKTIDLKFTIDKPYEILDKKRVVFKIEKRTNKCSYNGTKNVLSKKGDKYGRNQKDVRKRTGRSTD